MVDTHVLCMWMCVFVCMLEYVSLMCMYVCDVCVCVYESFVCVSIFKIIQFLHFSPGRLWPKPKAMSRNFFDRILYHHQQRFCHKICTQTASFLGYYLRKKNIYDFFVVVVFLFLSFLSCNVHFFLYSSVHTSGYGVLFMCVKMFVSISNGRRKKLLVKVFVAQNKTIFNVWTKWKFIW